MAAVSQVHAEHRVAGLDKRKINRHVGLRARVRLYVGVLRAEELFRPLNGQIFHLVHALAAAIVALAGITLGVFIGENRSHGRHDSRRDQILRGDQFNISSLAGQLFLHGTAQFRVILGHKADGIQHICIHGDHPFFLGNLGGKRLRFPPPVFLFSFSFIIMTQTKKINSLCILYWNQAKRSRYQNFYSRT